MKKPNITTEFHLRACDVNDSLTGISIKNARLKKLYINNSEDSFTHLTRISIGFLIIRLDICFLYNKL